MERRRFLGLIAAGVASAALGATAMELGPRSVGKNGWLTGAGGTVSEADVQARLVRSPLIDAVVMNDDPYLIPPGLTPSIFNLPDLTKIKLPGGTITSLKGHKPLMALTVDDGVSSTVVREYTNFAKLTGMRLTFFVTASYPSWTQNAPLLRPLVESGQIQLGNHTWSHPDLNLQTDARIVDELNRAHQFMYNTYGVDARPFFRPPYGNHNARVDQIAASVGYSTPVMWDGSFSDSSPVSAATLKTFANQYVQPERIVIGHANLPPIIDCFDYIRDLILTRKITPVTLNDLYLQA